MVATKLSTIRVEKPWGRKTLWTGFSDPGPSEPPIGEIWFEAPGQVAPDLLIKYLFTSERLSIQVHPDDVAARARGHRCGKDEAWIILDAEPGATVALGTNRPLTHDELRTAALDGSIEQLMHWQSVRAGDVIYSPAGTVHAIGAGLTIIEVQQNVDLTYRLYDYGRPRELHLDDGIAVSDPVPFDIQSVDKHLGDGLYWRVEGRRFRMDCLWGKNSVLTAHLVPTYLIPVSGHGKVCGTTFSPGECWLLEGDAPITEADDAKFILAGPVQPE